MENIWIDALEFQNYGGFMKETQFVREMGQGYLMADGVGRAVEPASVRFTVNEDGCYRVYIRTKNWCVGHEPDGLVVSVDGTASQTVCSQMYIQGWYFEIAGDFSLTKGEHTLTVADTTGWFGRFAAVIITNDFDFTPSPEIKRLKKQRAQIKGIKPCVADCGHFELLIAGGGVAGVVTAVAAARQGVKTALINDRPVLGGNGSDEGNVTLEGAAHRGYHETGIAYEIKTVKEKEQLSWSEAFLRVVQKEPNITLYSDMLIDDAETEENVIKWVHAVNTNDLTEYSFTADYFVDATGDGWLGYYAGAAYHVGREAKHQYGEAFAPDRADGNTMSGCAIYYRTKSDDTICNYLAEDIGEPVEFKAPSWGFKMPEGEAMSREPENFYRGQWWLENRNDYDDVWESEYVRDALIRMTVGYFDWLKNSWLEKALCTRLKCIGSYNAKRENRRLIGDYIMTQRDYEEKLCYEDAVCYCGWNIDVHHIKGIFSGNEGAFDQNKIIDITSIPFRTLYSKNISNLFMVGRCISVSHIGLGPTRVQLTCATMGQAVGTAAALCKKYGKTPRMVGKEHIKEFQQQLLKDGQYILGVYNTDKADLAREAEITADSYIEQGEPQNVANGYTRPCDGKPYSWTSEGDLPQSIYLKFEKEVKVNQLRLTFEIPFGEYSYGYKPQPERNDLITEFTVEAFIGGEWKELSHIKDNYQRLVCVKLDNVNTSKIKITALKAHNSSKAKIVEIRVY